MGAWSNLVVSLYWPIIFTLPQTQLLGSLAMSRMRVYLQREKIMLISYCAQRIVSTNLNCQFSLRMCFTSNHEQGTVDHTVISPLLMTKWHMYVKMWLCGHISLISWLWQDEASQWAHDVVATLIQRRKKVVCPVGPRLFIYIFWCASAGCML